MAAEPVKNSGKLSETGTGGAGTAGKTGLRKHLFITLSDRVISILPEEWKCSTHHDLAIGRLSLLQYHLPISTNRPTTFFMRL